MHRDTKLGLALAILVMGFAAALCFPRVSSEKSVDLTLQTAKELDSVIRLKQVKTYTDADRPKSRDAGVTAIEPVLPERNGAAIQTLAGVPDPILSPRTPEPTPIDPGAFPAEVVAASEPEPVVPTRTYRVQYGDTLSGIAKQELGSHTRWNELFAANRDQLRDANDLAPGMVLQIPIPSDDDVSPSSADPIVATPSVPSAPSNRVEPTLPDATSPRPGGRFTRPARIGSGSTAPHLN